jgi:two-component system, OmpR family, response regulator ResD
MNRRDRILVVEDDPESCETIAAVLSQAGYVVDKAVDGFEALALATLRRPDLVLSDLQLPGMTGIELIRRARSFMHSVPVVLTTGLAETRDVCTAPALYGAVACLAKPLNLDELLWAIDSALACVRVP